MLCVWGEGALAKDISLEGGYEARTVGWEGVVRFSDSVNQQDPSTHGSSMKLRL